MAAGEYFAFRRQDIDIPQAPQWITLFKRDGRLFERLSGRLNRQQSFRPAGGSQCSLLPDPAQPYSSASVCRAVTP